MKKVLDWAGNTIKNGDTIVVVRTKPLFRGMFFGFISENGFEKIHESKECPKHVWEVLSEIKIFMTDDGYLAYERVFQGVSCVFHLSVLEFNQPSDIICIKGVTDNEKMYLSSLKA